MPHLPINGRANDCVRFRAEEINPECNINHKKVHIAVYCLWPIGSPILRIDIGRRQTEIDLVLKCGTLLLVTVPNCFRPSSQFLFSFVGHCYREVMKSKCRFIHNKLESGIVSYLNHFVPFQSRMSNS